MTRPVTVVHLGRGSAGERVRVATWRAVLAAAGMAWDEVALCGSRWGIRVSNARRVLAGQMVPEALAWSARQCTGIPADSVVISITLRADVGPLLGSQRFVLDFVDRLSVSYQQRGEAARGLAALGFAQLARRHSPLERQPPRQPDLRVAAGRTDAAVLAAEWFPLVVEPAPAIPLVADDRPFDVVFFGSLSYLPNIVAVEELARAAQAAGRPWRVLIAGRRPHRRVRLVVQRHGWSLLEGYQSVAALAREASVAVVPLLHAAGIQTKVLEAAAEGIPQVVSPQALQGVDPALPAVEAATPDALAVAVDRLLGSPSERHDLAERAWHHVAEHYVAEAWAPWARRMVG